MSCALVPFSVCTTHSMAVGAIVDAELAANRGARRDERAAAAPGYSGARLTCMHPVLDLGAGPRRASPSPHRQNRVATMSTLTCSRSPPAAVVAPGVVALVRTGATWHELFESAYYQPPYSRAQSRGAPGRLCPEFRFRWIYFLADCRSPIMRNFNSALLASYCAWR